MSEENRERRVRNYYWIQATVCFASQENIATALDHNNIYFFYLGSHIYELQMPCILCGGPYMTISYT